MNSFLANVLFIFSYHRKTRLLTAAGVNRRRGCVYDPNYTPTRDIEQVVHTLSAMFKPISVEPELRQGL